MHEMIGLRGIRGFNGLLCFAGHLTVGVAKG